MSDVFVFGSNLAGRHGAGSALHAKKFYGAQHGHGSGRAGDSYAIPTKDYLLNTLPLATIQDYVEQFYDYAKDHWWESFHVVAIGCGLAGYTPKEMAPLFKNPPENVNLPEEFRKELGK